MRDIYFIDKTFDVTKTGEYHLSVQLSPDGLLYTVLDLSKGKYVVLAGYHFFLKRVLLLLKQVKEIVQKDELVRYAYKSVDICYFTKKFTFVPDVFYKDNCSFDFLAFNHPVEKGFSIMDNYFPRAKSHCLFRIPANLMDYLNETFPKGIIRHSLFPFIENGLKNSLNYAQQIQVKINFFRESFELSVLGGSKLIYVNVFDYKNEKDVLYFVLFVFDQLKLSPEESELIIYGCLPQVSPVFHLLKKYIRRALFAKPDTAFQYSYTFHQVPEHYFSSLLDQYRCE